LSQIKNKPEQLPKMATFLFNEIIFGPVQSRRLGISLGINLLPLESKLCNFNCLYCECGFTERILDNQDDKMPSLEEVHLKLENTLQAYKSSRKKLDTITFAGNGEPTLNPSFAEIIEDTVMLRNKLMPETKIAVLSNASLIFRRDVKDALLKVDYNIQKLDSSNEDTIKKINCPNGNFSIKKLIDGLCDFKENLTIQTLFIKGEFNGFYFDNTSDNEVEGWLLALNKIRPKLVMVYTIDRDTPVHSLVKVSRPKLDEIAGRVEQLGIPVTVSG
jgi:wyosine [tRNA(Phe)-imidazoG37] synthetase (radical SAM superfamily)